MLVGFCLNVVMKQPHLHATRFDFEEQHEASVVRTPRRGGHLAQAMKPTHGETKACSTECVEIERKQRMQTHTAHAMLESGKPMRPARHHD